MTKCPDCGFIPLHNSGAGLWCPMCIEYKPRAKLTIWELLQSMLERCKCLHERPCTVCAVDEVYILIQERIKSNG